MIAGVAAVERAELDSTEDRFMKKPSHLHCAHVVPIEERVYDVHRAQVDRPEGGEGVLRVRWNPKSATRRDEPQSASDLGAERART